MNSTCFFNVVVTGRGYLDAPNIRLTATRCRGKLVYLGAHKSERTEQRQEASNQDLHILWPFGRKVGDELPGEMRLLQPQPQWPPQKMSQMLKVDGALRDH